MKMNHDTITKNIIARIPSMTDDELINLTAEYFAACEMMEYMRRNDGAEYWNAAERWSAAITECKRRGINTRGLE